MKWSAASICLSLMLVSACSISDQEPSPGTITASTNFRSGIYHLPAPASLDTSVITISGSDLVLDFGGAVLRGSSEGTLPDTYQGIAIRVLDGQNITIRNLNIKGYKIGLYAENVEGLILENCDFSYNYRQRLGSKWDREALSDWLYYHDNEEDEWFRYGAAAYLKNCNQATVQGLRVTQGQNGLMLVGCSNGLYYNNDIRFNSGLGIGMYRSSNNRIMHNRLDWNVRGYSHGQYARGQDSAGILLYEQCSGNTIAFNSATHSGDGLFLWAGNHTMDTGEGGCNDNVIYQNDFSHSVANGIEVTFSSNIIIGNKLDDSRYGIWGGYSHHTFMKDNTMNGCDYGIAIEHGNHNQIIENTIENCDTGIQLWERDSQPPDWGFAEQRDVSSRNYTILSNHFTSVNTALDITNTVQMTLAGNIFDNVKRISTSNAFQEGVTGQIPGGMTSPSVVLPEPLPDGQNAFLPEGTLRGRQYMIVNEWGPYNFKYPLLCLRRIDGLDRNFSLFGPTGNWKLEAARGFDQANPKTGALPTAMQVRRIADSAALSLNLIFIGEAFVTQFGDTIEQGHQFPFEYTAYEPMTTWTVDFYNYDETTSPLGTNSLFSQLEVFDPDASIQVDQLAYRWWGAPVETVRSDGFATRARTTMTCAPGEYIMRTESDDGIRVFVDGKIVIDRWDVHTPEIDQARYRLGGTHEIEIHHFDNGGLAVLDFTLEPVSPEVN